MIRHDRVRLLCWDWKEQLDLNELTEAVADVSYATLFVTQVDTDADEYAIVVSNRPLAADEAKRLYDKRWEPPAAAAANPIVSSTSGAFASLRAWPGLSPAARQFVDPGGPCRSTHYEPGVTHEHHCLATSTHGASDHTCECGKTWPSLATGGAR